MRFLAAAVTAALFMVPVGLSAQDPQADSLKQAIDEVKGQVDALTRQLEALELGGEVISADTSIFGFGPAASRVYRINQGVSIGGYGEVLYENFSSTNESGAPAGVTDQLDALRGIVYVGYKFNDQIIFNSEIEVEHGSTAEEGSVSLEFAYLDYFITPNFGVRAGLLLSPQGFLNELHEPPVFLGSERPVTETVIIPSTFRENGIGIFGTVGDFDFRGYVINSFDGLGFGAGGLRGGRQRGSEALAEDFAGVGRVDYVGYPGLTVGSSLLVGNTGQGAVVPSTGETLDATTVIWEGHAEYKAFGFDLRGLLAVASVDDVPELNETIGLDPGETVGESLIGGYVQAGYDVLRSVRTQHELVPYFRWERVNTQNTVPTGFVADPAQNNTFFTIGAAWRPISSVILKSDYRFRSNDADTGVDQFNINIGYLF